ncbi:unnamed protein product [Adineta steineri]|uniref:Ketoreductase domain-containing protein n=1 Tax=Adineta steineri TaxID=433720 RepID=A0A815EZ11_9BILA|nr:unnamed protein product [Adineta steineri]CAF1318858.1 unnamed protein product [Adineta steineri]
MSDQHKGKLILNMKSELPALFPSTTIYNSQTCHILSGGTGALALQLVQHLNAHGAKRFLLLSRQGSNGLRSSDATMLTDLQRFGIEICIEKCDVAKLEDIQNVLHTAQMKFNVSSLKYSLLHLAIVLDDAPISKLNIQRIENVLQCKVTGAMNFLQLIPGEQLENVIFFSRAASTFENPSQANYSKANIFLDNYANQLSKL